MTACNDAPLYLSRLFLNPGSRQIWKELAEPYEMHRTLMHAFEQHPIMKGQNARELFNVLFRADTEERRDWVSVYVQSTVEPDWSFLHKHRDYLASDAPRPNPALKNVTESYKMLKCGQLLTFRLRANPTKRISKPINGNEALKGKRVGLLREEEQIAWLIRKGHEREKGISGGFEILERKVKDDNGNVRLVPCVTVSQEGKQDGRKREEGQPHKTTHLAVIFDGILRITDADAFRNTLISGIGSGKAFGFGLLSVARCRGQG